MDDFLRKIDLSEYAIEIYLKVIGKFSYSYHELYRILPKATIEQFNDCLNELIDAGLLIQVSSKSHDKLAHYNVLPPILPILNYYENINTNLPNIQKSIQKLIIDSINIIFQENKIIEFETLLNTFQEIKKDIDEDSIIQKQDVEDIVEGMEDLKNIKKNVSDLHQEIKSIIETKFADLLKTITTIKTTLIENTKKKETISLIEELFKKNLDEMVSDFSNNIHEEIEKKFNEIFKPIDHITDAIFQYRNDFKMLLLNMLTNFETNMNKIQELLKENDENLSVAIKTVENKIVEHLNVIIQNSINEVSNLNKPIEDVMKSYLQEISGIKEHLASNLWIVSSVIRINETIQNLILTSKESVTIIIPHVENHIALEQFESSRSNLKIKVISSEAHTNSFVKSLNNIKNILYRTYQNENLIILKADDDILFLGIIKESNDPLDDFIGIGSDFKPLIKLFDPLINNIWEKSYPDSFHATQVATHEFSKTTPSKTLTNVKPIIEMEMREKRAPVNVPSQIQEIPKDDKRVLKNQSKEPLVSITPKPQITDFKKTLKDKRDFVAEAQPQAERAAAIEINNAFNTLISKLDRIKGDEFGKDLQIIADLILEKIGFSVTLHKIRGIINKFKEKLTLLDANDKREIIESIENWKKRLY